MITKGHYFSDEKLFFKRTKQKDQTEKDTTLTFKIFVMLIGFCSLKTILYC